MDPTLFTADLEAKPAALRELAGRLDTAWPRPLSGPIVFVGMGSSGYAAALAASRLRAQGRHAIAETAGSTLLPEVDSAWTVVAISATGGSAETLDALDRLGAAGSVLALTNDPTSPLARRAHHVVDLHAGEERGGVACRTYQHTQALLLALESPRRAAEAARAAADACADLLDRRDRWLPDVTDLLAGPDGGYVVAPAERFANAQQGALMFREGPRRPATGCETADWSHVDVYLTKTLDYRMLLFAGSRWEPQLLDWTRQRNSTVVAVGADVPGTRHVVRYRGDDDSDVRLLTETLVAELVAARLWAAADGAPTAKPSAPTGQTEQS